jgi:lysozyme family protein
MPNVKDYIDSILAKEGKYVNNPNDSGGETNWGITVEEARANGYYAPMNIMARETAYDIYYKRYWLATGIAEIATIDAGIAERLLDIAVNQGIYRAGEFCQRLLNALNRNERDFKDLKVDAKIGAATREALRKFLEARGKGDKRTNSIEVFKKGLRAMQGHFYIDLAERRPKDEEFLYGWLFNRA